VFNVAHAVLKANYPDRPAFRLFEVDTARTADPTVTPISDRMSPTRRATDRAHVVGATSSSDDGKDSM
jgi:hypothetical protein